MEKLHCTDCEEFQEEAYCNCYSSSYYRFNESTGDYEWYDNGDGEDGDDYFCNECGNTLEFRDFNPEPTNKWEGQDRAVKQIETK